MPDVKDVIKGLEEMLEDSKYNDSVNWNPWADTETLEDAIALLKAQEPREREVETLNDIDRIFRCPACHKALLYENQRHCDWCGQAVKWDG